MSKKSDKNPWYVAGLHFGCQQCGGCCSGPGEGYIWATRAEVEKIADYLKISVGELRRKHIRRVGMRSSIIEHSVTKDRIFLQEIGGRKGCVIYPVRPNQCRTWPFWSSNLVRPGEWNEAGMRCPGINRGKLYGCEEIDRIRKQRKWWQDED